jgi:acyl CoA:acetate/3-ketoacid CoA transferase alpha subunit/acyl CoA:acetate/3-ketoacid CoA transferase beta subunit
MTGSLHISDVRRRWRALADNAASAPKLRPLAEAVRAHVRRGDVLYFGGSMARPNAAMFEVARAFWGSDPGFTLAAPAIANQHAPLIRAGLVRHAVTSIHAMTFPTPAPHPVYVRAAREATVEFENWSLLTLVVRLQAAALGLPFLPTNSLTGSDMAGDLAARGGYATVADPFGGGETGVVAPLSPDVTFIHGLAADEAGNVLVCPPFYDGKWAALAAGRAVIATVEKIVSPETIRRHSELVQLPAATVTCVCEVPLGGHPNSVPGDLVPEVGGYPDDYDFLAELRTAGDDEAALDDWSAEWITGCRDHQDYLARLGGRRINELRGRARADGWQFELGELVAARAGLPAGKAERHVVLAMRALVRRLEVGDLETILAGLGISSLAAWMAAIRLSEAGRTIPLMVEAGMYGYVPAPADPFLFNYRNMFSSTMLSDVETILGVMAAGPRNRAIGVLGAAQADSRGSINTTCLPDYLLTGSGGANDIASGAAEVMVTIGQSPKRLVEAVSFVTSPGRAVRLVVTPMAVFERRDTEFVLTRVMSQGERTLADIVEEVRASCGWSFEAAADLVAEGEPDTGEIELARLLDPQGLFLG